MDSYLKTIDTMVFMAFNNGFCTPKKDIWKNYAVKHRLLMYGYTDEEGRYYLNDKGLEYVLGGCSIGITERIERQNEMERLNIETQSFAKRKQKWIFRFAVVSFVLSILSILTQIGILSPILQWISDSTQWICSILQ